MTIETALSIGDWHFEDDMIPYQQFLDYGQYVNPHYVNLMGDLIDFGMISHHVENTFKMKGHESIRKEFNRVMENFQSVLSLFRKTFKRAKITYVPGNHEEWLIGYCLENPQLSLDFDIEYSHKTLSNLLGLKKLGIDILPFGEAFNIGKLYFRHGHEYGTQYPAKQAVLRSHRSMAIWHHHTRQIETAHSDIDMEEFVGLAVPCYCRKGMKYGKGKPNRWSNGFLWSAHKKSGNFSVGIMGTNSQGDFMTPEGKEYCL